MHRLLSLKSVYHCNFQHLFNGSLNVVGKNEKLLNYSCYFCQNTWKNLSNLGGIRIKLLKPNVRMQSTHAAIIQRASRNKKNKKTKKYVELLEINEKTSTQTKASVSKLNAKHLSKIVANTNVSLGQLHRLKTWKNQRQDLDSDCVIDRELLRQIENTLLNDNKQKDNSYIEDDCPIIFTSERVPNLHSLNNFENIRAIKDSFDKFRRATVRDQKMKDIIFAINEGINKNKFSKNPSSEESKNSQNIFGECLSDVKGTTLINCDPDKLEYIENPETNLQFNPEFLEEHLHTCDENGKFQESLLSYPEVKLDSQNNIKTIEKTSTKKVKKKHVNPLAMQHLQEIQKKAREHSLTKLLLTHLNICVSTGYLDKGYKILNYYQTKAKKCSNQPALKDVRLYNILLHGYAAQGDYAKSCDILEHMKMESISMDLQSYAAVLQCVECSNILDKQVVLSQLVDELTSKGFSLNDIVDKCKFTCDQKKQVLSAIKRFDPNFVPKYSMPKVNYDCKLLNQLNPDEFYKNENNKMKFSSPSEGLLSFHELMDKTLLQIQNEATGRVKIDNIENKGPVTDAVLYYRQKLQQWEDEWRDVIRKAFIRNLATLKLQTNVSHFAVNIYPYLSSLPIEEFVDLLIFEMRKLADGSETYSPTVRVLQKDLGYKVNLRYQILIKQKNGVMDKMKKLFEKYCDWYINRSSEDTEKFNCRRKWQEIVSTNREGASMDIQDILWPATICVGVGRFLYNILMNDIQVDINVFKRTSKKRKMLPALYSVYRGQGFLRRQEVKPHPFLVRLVRESVPPSLHMDTALIPSLCPPVPWTTPMHGGYLLTKNPVMRIPMGAVQQMQRLEDAPPQSLLPSLDSLNQLGAVPWRINQPILDILLHVFRSGGSKELCVARPASAAPQPPPMKASLTRKERSLAHRARAVTARRRQEMHSLWCDSLYKLSLANHYRNEIFWLPHNMDFRGRVYPCPPHLSHLGADGSRALMLFAKGKPLGPRGLDWLKLHCINLTGNMKRSTIAERLQYAEQIIDDILDSADNPLEGRLWWSKSDEPWQTLACCMEIAKASRTPNPEEYICHFPIHQDGSCNGLQHYAALGGDSAGAFSVNLSQADRPQDVYSAVATLVEASRANDAAAGVKIAQVLEGFIKRKVIKQTVMTTVYGVTKYGARLQISKQLKDIDKFPKEHIWSASNYLTGKTFESLSEMFTSTKQIQDWFTECARFISGVRGEKVEWVTPLGLPIVQPYHKISKGKYDSKGNILEFSSYDQHEKPCTIKQKNAFPPNFIHSLDSSHMMLTSLHCEASNITFVSVHDCFWTHPSTVEIMNKICREQFVALHSQPILNDLSEYLVSQYSFREEEMESSVNKNNIAKTKAMSVLKKLPLKGDFDLQNVLKSVYFFS